MKTRKLLQVCGIAILIAGCIGPREITIDPEELNRLKTEPEVRAVHYVPRVYLRVFHDLFIIRHSPNSQPTYSVAFEDPISRVQDRFVTGLTKKFDLHNVRSIGEARPISGDQFSLLKSTFGSGIVFDFETRYWKLYSSLYRGKATLVLSYAVRGRLIRVDDSETLWKAICNVDLEFEKGIDGDSPDFGSDDKALLNVKLLLAEETSVLTLKREEAEARCSNQLLNKFLGK